MDLDLNGARAIVTGGSQGIGLSVARGLLAEGARVSVVARGAERLESAADDLRAAHPGAEVVPLTADTTDRASVDAMVERAVALWGGVDILVNGAAQPSFSSGPADLAHLEDADVAADFDTKVLGYLRTARAVAPSMIAQEYGRIVNISGLNARRTGSISGTIRNVSVAALTANLADELGQHGIGVTVVHPGMVETERTPRLLADLADAQQRSVDEVRQGLAASTSLHRIVTAEELADVIVFLCSRRAAAITGDAVTVAAGNRGTVHY